MNCAARNAQHTVLLKHLQPVILLSLNSTGVICILQCMNSLTDLSGATGGVRS